MSDEKKRTPPTEEVPGEERRETAGGRPAQSGLPDQGELEREKTTPDHPFRMPSNPSTEKEDSSDLPFGR